MQIFELLDKFWRLLVFVVVRDDLGPEMASVKCYCHWSCLPKILVLFETIYLLCVTLQRDFN